MNYEVRTNDGRREEFGSWAEAKECARIFGAVAFYDCDDGRTFFYATQEDCDLAVNGVELGAIEEVES